MVNRHNLFKTRRQLFLEREIFRKNLAIVVNWIVVMIELKLYFFNVFSYVLLTTCYFLLFPLLLTRLWLRVTR